MASLRMIARCSILRTSEFERRQFVFLKPVRPFAFGFVCSTTVILGKSGVVVREQDTQASISGCEWEAWRQIGRRTWAEGFYMVHWGWSSLNSFHGIGARRNWQVILD